MSAITPSLYLFLGLLVISTCSDISSSTQPTDLFYGFFPCVPGSVNMSTQEDAQNCDLFVYAAVQLALDRVEEELERDQRRLHLSSVVTDRSSETERSDVNQVLYNLYVEINREGQRFPESLNITRAAIGTDDNFAHGVPVTLFAERIGVPIVSYGLADDRLNNYSVFYRTIPSTFIMNQARLTVLARFKWYRIGILGSSQKEYKYQMESFRGYFNAYVERQYRAELSYEGTTSLLQQSLLDLHRFDIRIILGFFGPEEMRMVLCEASSEKYHLTTSDHVWILPSYYNPDWWKGGGAGYQSDQRTVNCTDEEMMNILQSVIFLDSVKYPPMESPLSEFYPALLNKTRELFTQLSPEVKLEPLLQHSRAVSAYDSTLLLAHSLTEGRVDNITLYSNIVCELCRIYPVMFLPPNNLVFCQKVLPVCQNSSRSKDSLDLKRNVSRDIVLAAYGQVLITQFITVVCLSTNELFNISNESFICTDDTHCPMVLFWPIESNTPEQLVRNYVPISNLSNFSGTLELDPEVMFPNIADCPQNFTWKGRDSPPLSNFLITSEIPVWALAFVGVVTGLGEVLIVFLIVFSIIWRENVHVKSTSPRVNVVMLAGAALYIPYSVIHGIILSGNRYGLQKQESLGTRLCQLNQWIPVIGVTLIMTGLAVKIFRLYRIFRNSSLRVKLRHLYDRDLIIAALVLLIPVVVVLVVWTAIPESRLEFLRNYIENGNIQYIQVTHCWSKRYEISTIFDALIRVYLTIVFLTALFLSLFITGAPKSIRIDLSMTRAAVAVGTVTVVISSIAEVVARADLLAYEIVWWFKVLDIVFGTITVMALLILYQVILVFRDYQKKVKEKYCPKVSEHFPNCKPQETLDHEVYYKNLLKEITKLSSSLDEKEASIRQLRAQNQVLGGVNSVKTNTSEVRFILV